MAFCSIDGQQGAYGDSATLFCLQSCRSVARTLAHPEWACRSPRLPSLPLVCQQQTDHVRDRLGAARVRLRPQVLRARALGPQLQRAGAGPQQPAAQPAHQLGRDRLRLAHPPRQAAVRRMDGARAEGREGGREEGVGGGRVGGHVCGWARRTGVDGSWCTGPRFARFRTAARSHTFLYPSESLQRFEFVLQQWRELSGGTPIEFSNATYLSERATANRNHALAHLLVRSLRVCASGQANVALTPSGTGTENNSVSKRPSRPRPTCKRPWTCTLCSAQSR